MNGPPSRRAADDAILQLHNRRISAIFPSETLRETGTRKPVAPGFPKMKLSEIHAQENVVTPTNTIEATHELPVYLVVSGMSVCL